MRRSLLLCGISSAPLILVCLLGGQSPAPNPLPNPQSYSPQDNTGVLRVRVDLVLVPVVVRDLNGHAVGNLREEDFTLPDNNKQQQIVSFAIDKPASKPIVAAASNPAGA